MSILDLNNECQLYRKKTITILWTMRRSLFIFTSYYCLCRAFIYFKHDVAEMKTWEKLPYIPLHTTNQDLIIAGAHAGACTGGLHRHGPHTSPVPAAGHEGTREVIFPTGRARPARRETKIIDILYYWMYCLLNAVPNLHLVCSIYNSDLLIPFIIEFEFLYSDRR